MIFAFRLPEMVECGSWRACEEIKFNFPTHMICCSKFDVRQAVRLVLFVLFALGNERAERGGQLSRFFSSL